jgi:hypothetical protein
LRTKSKSVCEAEGKPFDFLQADLDQQVEDAQLLSALIGSISAWLPSRRSVLIQIGGLLMIGVRPLTVGQLTAGKARYGSWVLQHHGRVLLKIGKSMVVAQSLPGRPRNTRQAATDR